MKPYKYYLTLLLIPIAMITSCSPDETYTDTCSTKPNEANALHISINRTGFLPDSKDAETRVGHDGQYNVTDFVAGDRIGIIGISGGEIVFNNYEYKYENGIWKAVDNNKICYAQPNMTYIAYYPYSANMNGSRNEADILTNFDLTDVQTTLKDENDLMAATVTVTAATNEITFKMQHLLCLLELQSPTYTYIWDNTSIPTTMHTDNIVNNFIRYDNKTYEIGKNNKYLLVKPGENKTIKAAEWTPNDHIDYETEQKEITLSSNKRYIIARNFKFTATPQVGDPFYMTSNRFGFPYPQELKNAPTNCAKIGTVVKMGREFEAAIYQGGNTNKATDTQAYKNINNTTLGIQRGYIASDYKYLGPLFDANQNKAPSSLEQNTVHGYTYTYQYCINSKPYDNFLKTDANHPTNTSKWFIPGVAEAYAILDITPNNNQNYWTCDRANSSANYYFSNRGTKVIAHIGYTDSGYCHTIFMLAF